MFPASEPATTARQPPAPHPLPPLDSSAMVACALLGALLVVAQPVSAFVAPALWRLTKSSTVWPSTSGSSQSRGGTILKSRGGTTSRATVRIRSCTSMTPDQFAGGDGGNPRPLPDDPVELAKMEREFYQNQKEFKRLAQLKKELEDLPKQRQCHRYRWTQTETTFDVEIPMQKACEDKDLYLVVEKDQMQVAIKTDEAFGAITGVFPGDVDASSCSFRIHNHNNEPYVHIEIVKMTSPGTYEFWNELLQGEVESPTIRFAGRTARYGWKQNAETIEVEIPVPIDVTKRKTKLDLDPAGASMHLSFSNRPDFEPLEGKFKALISPLDSVWMLDEGKDGKVLALTIKKRRGERDTTEWWSGVLEGDDAW